MMDSSRPMESPDSHNSKTPTIFICGFIPKRWHNSSLQAVIQDLLPLYYIACNGEDWHSSPSTHSLISHADSLIFFVNEYTLGDENCLLTLQYAWQLMIPILMLRPPKTKLVICKRNDYLSQSVISRNGSIMRSPSNFWNLIDNTSMNVIDYPLLQDVLYQGYKVSVVYDRIEHIKSMSRIKRRLHEIVKTTHLQSACRIDSNIDKPAFYLSPSNDSSNSLSPLSPNNNNNHDSTSPMPTDMRISLSMNDLNQTRMKRATPRHINPSIITDDEQTSIRIPPIRNEKTSKMRHKPSRRRGISTDSSERSESSLVASRISNSQTSSLDRRMSMSSLDDVSNYQHTQYLVFPLKDSNKKPQLIKFPQDLIEDQLKEDSVWGSDTSLEQEANIIAPRISTGFSMDHDLESPIASPAPYIQDI